MINVYQNTWASIVVWVKDIIEEVQAENMNAPVQFIDWEAHANEMELPDADLIGPSTVAITEYEDGLHRVSFAVGVSSFANDRSLFRQRSAINMIYNKLQSGMRITYYDYQAVSEKSVIQITPGTLIAPMNDITVRPFQYVQTSGLLMPDEQDV